MKILIPIDFSPLSHFALEMAENLAEKADIEVHALHIVLAPPNAVFSPEGELKDCNDFDVSRLHNQQDETSKQLNRLQEEFPVITHTVSKIGHILDGIMDYAESESMDMILMGINGVSGIKEITTGSLAERLVRNSSIPVLTLKCSRKGMDLSNIVLAGVFDAGEKQDLSVVKLIQDKQGATLHLLQVNTPDHFVPQRDAMKNMRAYVQANELENVEFHLWSDESVEKGIRHFCLDNQVDFLAMGTHGRSGLMHLFKGSLTEDIVNHVFQPVLSFHLGS